MIGTLIAGTNYATILRTKNQKRIIFEKQPHGQSSIVIASIGRHVYVVEKSFKRLLNNTVGGMNPDCVRGFGRVIIGF